MNVNMATRRPAGLIGVTLDSVTEFHMHKSHRIPSNGMQNKVIDYTEFRLARYIETIKDPQQHTALIELIKNYKAGRVTIAWKRGMPVWLDITKDT